MMRPYWITFDPAHSQPSTIGAGITALSEDDAATIGAAAFGSSVRIASIRAIEDISQLDQDHVVPNMGLWLRRGVWFPMGFESHLD